MWATRLSIVDWVHSKTLTLLATLKTRHQPQGESCVFAKVEHLFLSVGRARNKRQSTTVLQNQKIISLDAGLRMDGLPALDLWETVIEVLRSTNNTARHGKLVQGDLCGTGEHSINKNKTKTLTETRERDIEQLSNVDDVPTNPHSSQGESQLFIFDDNEAVIEMIVKGRSPTMRHVSRTHRVAIDWLFDRINVEAKDPNQIC